VEKFLQKQRQGGEARSTRIAKAGSNTEPVQPCGTGPLASASELHFADRCCCFAGHAHPPPSSTGPGMGAVGARCAARCFFDVCDVGHPHRASGIFWRGWDHLQKRGKLEAYQWASTSRRWVAAGLLSHELLRRSFCALRVYELRGGFVGCRGTGTGHRAPIDSHPLPPATSTSHEIMAATTHHDGPRPLQPTTAADQSATRPRSRRRPTAEGQRARGWGWI